MQLIVFLYPGNVTGCFFFASITYSLRQHRNQTSKVINWIKVEKEPAQLSYNRVIS